MLPILHSKRRQTNCLPLFLLRSRFTLLALSHRLGDWQLGIRDEWAAPLGSLLEGRTPSCLIDRGAGAFVRPTVHKGIDGVRAFVAGVVLNDKWDLGLATELLIEVVILDELVKTDSFILGASYASELIHLVSHVSDRAGSLLLSTFGSIENNNIFETF